MSIKVGDIVKLKNPRKKGEEKRRWRVETVVVPSANLRRLDTRTRRAETHLLDTLAPISFWGRIWRRY